MAQKKKKKTQLSILDKAIMEAYNWPDRRPEALKEFKAQVRAKYNELMSQIGATHSYDYSDDIDRKFKNLATSFLINTQTNDINIAYAALTRTMVLGSWMRERIVFRISQDTMQFIKNLHLMDNLEHNAARTLESICKKPIYLDIQDDNGRRGCFAGTHFMMPPNTPHIKDDSGNIVPLFFCIPVGCESNAIGCTCFGDTTLSNLKHEHRIGKIEEISEFCEIITYIAYYWNMQDSMNTVFIPDMSKPYIAYDVLPIPCTENVPDFTVSSGWVAAGLCNACGFLNAENMNKAISRELKLLGHENAMYGTLEETETDITADDSYYTRRIGQAILDWENHKAVYQYSAKTMRILYKKYMEELNLTGLTEELLRYFPYDAIVISNSDMRILTIVTLCKVKYPNGRIYTSALAKIIDSMVTQRHMGLMTASSANHMYFDDGPYTTYLFEAFVILYHILTVLQTKAQKHLTEDIMASGNPASTALLPTEIKAAHQPSGKAKPETNLRFGEAIMMPSFEINEVTVRTVKRIPQKEALQRGGWKMIPHMRRGHPHRYWVGKGEQRHMEIRWLDPMHINAKAKKTAGETIVHEIMP